MANRVEQPEQLTAYLDGELSPAQRAEVERLIASESEARQLLEDLQETSRLVAALPPEQAPADLADAVVSRMERRDLLDEKLGKSQKVKKLESQKIEATGVAVWARRFAVAASFALVCTAVWMAWSQWSGPTAERRQPIRLAQADKAPTGHAQEPFRQHERIGPGLALAPSRRSRPLNPTKPKAPRGRAGPSSTPLALGYAGVEEEIPAAAKPAVSYAAAAKTKVMNPTVLSDRRIAARIIPTRKEPRPIVVEADGATVAKLTDLIQKGMSRHAIPMLDAESHNQPTPSDEPFFMLQRVKTSSRSAGNSEVRQSPADQSTNEVRIVIHARRDVAGEILSSVRRITKETGTFGKKAAEKRQSARQLDVNEMTTTAKAPDEQGLVDDFRTAFAKRRSGRLSRRRPTLQAAGVKKEPFVTLSIILRVKGSADSPAGALDTTTKPASQPAAKPQ